MKQLLHRTKQSFAQTIALPRVIGMGVIIAISCLAWLVSYTMGLTTIYNDAMSHLDITRLVVDDVQPGLSQLGGVWLPLNHLLSLTLVWNNWAWHSGFAGSFFSMLSFIISGVTIYSIVLSLTKRRLPASIAALVFATNLNILYLQTTPLTEPLYLATFILSVYSFLNWVQKRNDKYLVLLGFFGFLQVLTRYDGWFVVGIEGLLVLLQQMLVERKQIGEAMGKVLVFALPSIFGACMWLLWNLLIFNNPLYFMVGPYSAHAQQATIQSRAGLLTKDNILASFVAYFYAMADNIGVWLLALSFLAIPFFLKRKERAFSLANKFLFVGFILTPIIFNIFALYLGFSILNVPELHWNPSHDPSSAWFNVRYGIIALPFVAIMIGLLANFAGKLKALSLGIVLLLAFQIYALANYGIITIKDGTVGSSAFVNNDVAQYLHKEVQPHEEVLLSMSFYNAVAFKSGLPLNQIIHEGVSNNNEWSKSLVEPENYAKWIVMANGKLSEPVYTSLVENQQNRFLRLYTLVYKGEHANVYRLKTPDETYISVKNGSIYEEAPFIIHGVNSYDIAYKSNSEIETTFKDLNSIGVNTLRFWMFGDGSSDGFQPKAGIVNETRLRQADYVFAMARKYHIRLIPVLVNNWTDYGGKEQYCAWVGISGAICQNDFYINQASIKLFENYINHIISRKNTITGISYVNDPSILAWEIINEPRTGDTNTSALQTWLQTIATYIKSIDQNHLVASGIEKSHIVANNSSSSFNLCDIEAVDICSIHLYLYQDNTPIYKNTDELQTFLQEQVNAAKEVNKPMYIGEFGVAKNTQPFGSNPISVMAQINEHNIHLGYNGTVIWNWALSSDTSYGFSPFGDIQGRYNLSDLEKLMK